MHQSFHALVTLAFAVVIGLGSAALASSQDRYRINTTPEVLVLNTAPAGAAPAEMTPVTSASGTVELQRTFLDEFSSFTPNTPPWQHRADYGPAHVYWNRTLKTSGQQQLYVDPAYRGTGLWALELNPFSVKDGVLEITGSHAPRDMVPQIEGYKFISGMLSSVVSFEQKYGFFEARMRLPGGQGVWPAFWLKRGTRLAPEGTPPWPPEIDIMEHIGEANRYHVTSHWDLPPDNEFSNLKLDVEDPTERFHNYGVLWDEERTVFYLDRQPVAQIETKSNHHVEMFILINLALGGNWPGPVDETALPATLEIDWVSVWQFEGK